MTWNVDGHGTSGRWWEAGRSLSFADAEQKCAKLRSDGYGSRMYPEGETPDEDRAWEFIGKYVVCFDEPALGVMGDKGERTVVRRTTSDRFVVMTASKPYRVIRDFDNANVARAYNISIHG